MWLKNISTLTPQLQKEIKERPTLTLLRNASATAERDFSSIPKVKETRDTPVPDTFNGPEVWRGILSPIRNQGACGSCWAFATSSTLADRFNLESRGKLHLTLSPTKMVLCDFMGQEFTVKHPELNQDIVNEIASSALTTGACQGNTLYDAWRYLYIFGTPPESCVPYDGVLGGEFALDSLSSFVKDSRLPLCSNTTGPLGDMCSDVAFDKNSGDEYGTPARFFRCLHFYAIPGVEKDGGSEYNIRQNIYLWGPVTTGMDVYPDFYTFDPKKEIYEWNGRGEQVGGHAIAIVGWGEENGVKYWIIRNSWGESWGRNGYFYMKRGTNTCKIEENVISAVPDFFYPIEHPLKDPRSFNWAESANVREQRRQFSVDRSIVAGGLDPETGYTRRVMATKPWVDLKRPIPLSELPNWDTFVAGEVIAPKKPKEKVAIDLLLWGSIAIILLITVIVAIVRFK